MPNKTRKEICEKYRNNNREKVRESQRNYQNSEKGKRQKDTYYSKNKLRAFECKLLRKFGITFKEYKEIWDSQNGLCLICTRPETQKGVTWLCVDHDHSTGLIRGLLCRNCNIAIGNFKENVFALYGAISYLRNFGK